MKTGSLTKKIIATVVVTVLMTSEIGRFMGTDGNVHAEEIIPAVETGEEIADNDTVESVIWKTGVDFVGDLIPGGKTIGPLLTALGEIFGIKSDKDTSSKELLKQLDDVNKKIATMSSDITSFRMEMDTRLNELEKNMYAEIEDALNVINNDVFTDGVGAELDTLHTQVSGRNGIARKIDTINEDSEMSDEEKAIEIAYLIGNDKDWNETQNALYRFKHIGELLAGQTYRDTKGRNLYQVLYDNAASNSKLSGEVYDKIEPYIDRVVYEYFLSYVTLSQCLSASLTVSLMTDEEAKKLDAVTYNRYLACKTVTSVVKQEMDDIDKQLLDPDEANSIVSLYSAFRYKQNNNGCVYIDGGKNSVALSPELDEFNCSRVGKLQHNGSVSETSYCQGISDFVSGGEHLDPEHVKKICDHVDDLPDNTTLLDYLDNAGFKVDEHKTGCNSRFAVSNMKTRRYDTGAATGCEYGFDMVNPRAEENSSTFSVACDFVTEDQGVFATLNDVSCLGLKITESEEMPDTAREIYELEHTDHSVQIGPVDQIFELYQKYALEYIPVTVRGEDGNAISSDALTLYPDGSRYKWEFSDEPYVFFDGDHIIFKEAGTTSLRVSVLDPSGRKSVSDWFEITGQENHSSTNLYIGSGDEKKIYTVDSYHNGAVDLSEMIPVDIYEKGEGTVADRKVTDVTLIWESENLPLDGILLDDTGIVTFTRQGEFRVRCKAVDTEGDYAYSDWFTINVNDPEEHFTLTFLDSDGSELNRITGKEGSNIYTGQIPVKEGYVFKHWDCMDSEDDEIPSKMPGESRSYTAVWERTVKDGYITVTDETSLNKAIAEAPASETTRIALGNDITVTKLLFPGSKDADIVIDGVDHILTFAGSAVILPKNDQSLTLKDITLKAEKNGKTKKIAITGAGGKLSLDNVVLTCFQAVITAKKGDLLLNKVISDKLVVKGSPKSVLTAENEVAPREISGFGKVFVNGTLIPAKILKTDHLSLSSKGHLKVLKGVVITIQKGISGTGIIDLSDGFTPISIGNDNSGAIMINSEVPLMNRMIFKSKAGNLNKVFNLKGIPGIDETGGLKCGLYVKAGKAYLRAFTMKYSGRSYCEWNDLLSDISKAKPADDISVTLLSDVTVSGTLKLPAKGKYRNLTIIGGGHTISFTGKTVSLTGNLTLRDIRIKQKKGTWVLKKGKYELTNDEAKLIGCTIK